MIEIEFWERISSIIQLAIVIVGVGGGGYYIWKTRKNTAKDDAIKAYKDVIDAYTLKIKEFEDALGEVKAENKELQAQVNQLIGENKALKNVKPSIAFESITTSILTEMKALSKHQAELRQDFVDHSTQDNDRFKTLGDLAKSNNDMLLKMCPGNA